MRIARVVNRCLQAAFALAAGGGLLSAPHAAEPSGIDASVEYAPAPVSTLVSRRDLPFRLARVQGQADQMIVLAYQAPGGRPAPVAVISSRTSSGRALVSLHRLALPQDAADLPLGVVTLEHLYFQAMRLDPDAAFCFSDSGQACDAASSSYSHAALLRDLAAARQRALSPSGQASGGMPWQVVTLTPPAVRHADPDEVGARITGLQGPMPGVKLFFNRAPHSSCVATSGADGLATCRLVDQHGDGDAHSEQDHAPVLTTYPGDVRAERVLLPTTLVLESP
jgi:hypothetical protein